MISFIMYYADRKKKMCLVLILTDDFGGSVLSDTTRATKGDQDHLMPNRAPHTLQFSGHHCSWALVLNVLLSHYVPGSRAGTSHFWLQSPFPASYLSVIAWDDRWSCPQDDGLKVWWELGGMLLGASASGEPPTFSPPSTGCGGQEHCAHLPLDLCLDTY